MPAIFADNSLSIGRSPLIKLNRLAAGSKATVLAMILVTSSVTYCYLRHGPVVSADVCL